MLAIRWSDVGRAELPGEQKIEGLELSIAAEHIAQWGADPDGVWQIEKVRSSDDRPLAGLSLAGILQRARAKAQGRQS